MNAHGEVCLIFVLSLANGDYNAESQPFAEVVHDDCCIDLLHDGVCLPCMKADHVKTVFDFTKAGLDAPSQVVEILQHVRRKFLSV